MHHQISLPAVLTAEMVPSVQAQLHQQICACAGDAAIVLDASGVTSFDSAGIALLLSCRRIALTNGQSFQVQAWTQRLQALANVYGVLHLLDPACAQASGQ